MDILLYLIELIQTRKEIGLDGLGTLYKKKSSGRYDIETHLFLPPSYVLDFTPAVKENQNLAQFISKKRNISIESANYFISQFIAEIQKELKENGTFLLENLGKLNRNDGEISFVPAKDINFGFDFYGLPPIDNKVKEPESVADENEEINPQPASEDLTLAENIAEENKLEDENPGNETAVEEIPSETIEETEPISQEETAVNEIIAEEEETKEEAPEKEFIADEHDWNFDDFTKDFGTIALDKPIEEKPEEESANEEPIISETKSESPISEEEEVYEEISEINSPIPSQASANPSPAPEEIESDFSKNWEFDEEEPKPEKPTEIISPFDEETGEEIVATNKGLPQYVKVLLVAIILLAAVTVIYFIKPNLFSSFVKNDVDPDQKIAVPIAERENLKTQKDSLATADEIVRNAQDLGLEVEKPRDTLKATVTEKPLSGTTYEVISVAFQTQKEVDKYIQTMKRRGIVAKAVPAMPGKLMIKVSVATFNNLDSAYKELPILKKTLKNQGLYIHTNKQK